MKKCKRIIKLEEHIKVSKEEKNFEEDIHENFEDWEEDYELINKGDFEGLIKYRERIAKNNPNDVYSQWPLGEAYILNKEYEKAIEFLSHLHRKYPDHGDIHYSILDALFSIGKSEKDFDWVSVPAVVRLNRDVLDYCYELLKRKRKARELNDLYCGLMSMGYLSFNENDFLNYLSADERFEIEKDSNIHCSLVSIVSKKKKS
ncbi:MAG: hypothetical protein O2U61_07405 [Candidatus Bathyarchaeota archaeon]|nr:hypothetical protein [Candidatus Bathyarchaeota archaeon]